MKSLMLEYIWLDGYSSPNLRSKVKVMKWGKSDAPVAADLPDWNFDGSSTRQAPGESSECLLRPARVYEWEENHYFVLCEVFNSDGSVHPSNQRAGLRNFQTESEDGKYWWGFEQEYFITKDFIPLGFPKGGYPKPQGLYYCGVGGNQVRMMEN